MREHPVLFSPPMIRALLAGRKFVTRRLDKRWMKVKAGDRLWVKEGWRPIDVRGGLNVQYFAGGEGQFFRYADIPEGWMVPKAAARGQVTCLFMPRWASRISLEVEEDTREERLQDITGEEVFAEGIEAIGNYRAHFRELWQSLHTKPGERWEDNPIVRRVGRFHQIEGGSHAR